MTKNPFSILLGISLIILAGLGFNNMLPFAEKGGWDYMLNIFFLVWVLVYCLKIFLIQNKLM